MIISCPECDTRYDVDDDRFHPAGLSVRCAACGESWFVPAPQPIEDLVGARRRAREAGEGEGGGERSGRKPDDRRRARDEAPDESRRGSDERPRRDLGGEGREDAGEGGEEKGRGGLWNRGRDSRDDRDNREPRDDAARRVRGDDEDDEADGDFRRGRAKAPRGFGDEEEDDRLFKRDDDRASSGRKDEARGRGRDGDEERGGRARRDEALRFGDDGDRDSRDRGDRQGERGLGDRASRAGIVDADFEDVEDDDDVDDDLGPRERGFGRKLRADRRRATALARLDDLGPVAERVFNDEFFAALRVQPRELERAIRKARRRAEAREKNRMTPLRALGWSAWAGIVAATLFVVYTYRDSIVAMWPQTAGAYAVIGVQAAPNGLRIERVSHRLAMSTNGATIEIAGALKNDGDKPAPPPLMQAEALGPKGELLSRWTFRVESQEIAQGASAEFTTRAPAPEDVVEVAISFAPEKAGKAKAGEAEPR